MTGRLEERIHEHRERLIRGFAAKYNADKLIFLEPFPEPLQAIAREKQLKGWSRKKKIELINKSNPSWKDLFEEIAPGSNGP